MMLCSCGENVCGDGWSMLSATGSWSPTEQISASRELTAPPCRKKKSTGLLAVKIHHQPFPKASARLLHKGLHHLRHNTPSETQRGTITAPWRQVAPKKRPNRIGSNIVGVKVPVEGNNECQCLVANLHAGSRQRGGAGSWR